MASIPHPTQQQAQHQELLKQAIEAHLQGQLGRAEDLYRVVLDGDPTNPVLYANLGTLCLATGRYPEAIDLLKQALALKPDYALALNSLGIVWQQQQDWEQALHCYQQALDLQPDDTLVTLGDYVDRGPDSKGVIDRLIALKDQVNLVAIMGNHDEMMLRDRKSTRLNSSHRT